MIFLSHDVSFEVDLVADFTTAENPRDMAQNKANWRRGWLVAVAAGGVLLAYGLHTLRAPRGLLLEQWQRELLQVPPAEIEPRLIQIAALGDEGLPVLVNALHSSRPVVAQAASRQLHRLLEDWQQYPPAQRSTALAKLAATLAQQATATGPDASQQTMWLAQRILLQPIDRQSIDGSQLVHDCETVLRVCAAQLPNDAPASDLHDQARPVPTLASQDLVSLASSSPAVNEVPTPSVEATAPNAATVSLSDLPRIDASEPSGMAPFLPPSGLSAGEPNETLLPPPSARLTVMTPESHSQARPPITPLQPVAQRADHWGAMTDWEVMRQLNSPDVDVVGAAVRELTRRGFQPLHLQLAERLVAPDPDTRLELVTQLPTLAGIEARAWLLLLSRDPDATVRAATVRLLATSNDPALQAEIERMAREETDDGVLRVVRQVRNASRDR